MRRPRIRTRESTAPNHIHDLEVESRHVQDQVIAKAQDEAAAARQVDAARLRLSAARMARKQAQQGLGHRRGIRNALAHHLAQATDWLKRLRENIKAERDAMVVISVKAAAATTETECVGTMRYIVSAVKDQARKLRTVADQATTVIRAWKCSLTAASPAIHRQRSASIHLENAHAITHLKQAQVIPAQAQATSLRQSVGVQLEAITGLKADGLVRYLMRATPAALHIVKEAHQQALAEGQARAGRPPSASHDSEATARRARRAERAKERRQQNPIDRTSTSSGARRTKRREERRQQRAEAGALINPTVDGSRPAVRQHEERMRSMSPEAQRGYLAHLIDARRNGRAAAAWEATLLQALPHPTWNGSAPSIALGDGARLVAVRGGDASTLAACLIWDDHAVERWLGEPGLERNRRYGAKARLTNYAGHLVSAWSPSLAALAMTGGLDQAFAFEVDRVIARLGLEGHRGAAFLHLDSKTGHPHLHIVFSRVRTDDYALWSISGRERTPALWLHGRTTTALACGVAALSDDVDALAGTSPAARAGERLMWEGKLAATLRHLDGTVEAVPLQGTASAKRIASVGAFPGDHALAGGIWLFGMGIDPVEKRDWQSAMTKAVKNNDFDTQTSLAQHRPAKRGYWLTPDREAPTGMEWRYNARYGWYLARCKTAA